MIRALTMAALLAGCDQPLVDETYRGEPLHHIATTVLDDHTPAAPNEDVRMALFWSPGGATVRDPDDWVEQPTSGLPVSFPRSVDLYLFDTPGVAHRVEASETAPYAIGRALAYVDEDGNRLHDPGERWAGGAIDMVVVWAARALSAEEAPHGRPLAAGFHRLRLPWVCDQTLPEPSDDGDCGVDIGRPCLSDQECPGGSCLQYFHVVWSGGVCTVPEPRGDGCRPQNAAFVPSPEMEDARGYYLEACTEDADCEPRRGPTGCEPAWGACMLERPMEVQLQGALSLSPVCAGDPRFGGERFTPPVSPR